MTILVTSVQPGKSKGGYGWAARGHASFPPFEPLSTEHWKKRLILIGASASAPTCYLLLLTLQAEHLASRPGYLALAVDGATPGPGLAACSDGGIPAQCR